MGDADLGDTNSLDSSGSTALATDENHSSNSEIEQLEQDEAESLEEELGMEVAEEEGQISETDEDIQAPKTQELLVSAEEPHIDVQSVEFMQVVPPMALPPLPILQFAPPSSNSPPVPSTMAWENKELDFTPHNLYPPSILGQMNSPIVNTSPDDLSEKHSAQASQGTSQERDHTEPEAAKMQRPTELPVLLCGGAALVAVVGVVAYGAVAYCRK